MHPGYGFHRRVRTARYLAVGEQGSPQFRAPVGRRGPPHAILFRMQMVIDQVRWCATDDERSLLAWVADRATAAGRHLAPIRLVGRLADGRLAVDVIRPAGTPLSAALDTLGAPTTGVAVTLTVPLLELAAAGRSGAVEIGRAGLDDVLVDDVGAVLLCDRPPGAVTMAPSTPSTPSTPSSSDAGLRSGDALAGHGGGHRQSDQDGSRILLLAARMVWERTDERDPVRPAVDVALADALDGGVEAVRAALSVVRATAAPRPIRWEPQPHDLLLGFPSVTPTPDRTVAGTLRDVVEHGVPLGSGRRLPLRRAVVGGAVATGLTAAAVFALA